MAGRLREGRGNRGRESVILDAADEAIFKATYHRQASRTKIKEKENSRDTSLPQILRSSMDFMHELDGSEVLVKEDDADEKGGEM